MRTQYYTASSLDGFIATEDDSLDWLLALGDVSESSYPTFISEVGALAMGAATYEWVLRSLAEPDSEGGGAWPYSQPAFVFTHRRLPIVEGADTRFVQGDVRPVHQTMMQVAAGRNIWLVGGGELVGQFLDAGLLDEIIVQVAAVTLGRGKALLPRRITTPPLRLTSVTPFGSAFVELRYEVPREGANAA
jgi:dihydrofolate reductase